MQQMVEDQSTKPIITVNKTNMILPNRKVTKLLKTGGVIVAIAALLIVVSAIATGRSVTSIVVFTATQPLDSVRFSKDEKVLTFTDVDLRQDYLNVYFPHEVTGSRFSKASNCQLGTRGSDVKQISASECLAHLNLELEGGLSAVIHESDASGLQCHSVEWHSNDTTKEITNCFSMEDSWYGGGGLSEQRWPLNRVNVPSQPHLTQKFPVDGSGDTERTSFDAFIEPYFVSAKGVAVLFEPYLPLFVSMNHANSKKLCFTTAYKKPYASLDVQKKLILKYIVCKDRTAKSVHEHLLKTRKMPFFNGSPQTEILRKPMWSTRGFNLAGINELEVLTMVKGVKSNKLLFGQLFIDGNYSKSAGNFYFGEKKFPHSHQLIMELNSPGEENLPVGIEVYPHVSSENSKLFAIQYTNSSLSQPDKRHSFFLDVTNTEAAKQYGIQLTNLIQQINIKGFRFSGGFALDILDGLDLSYLITNKSLENPNFFTNKYAEIASEFKGAVLIGSGYRSQNHTFIADAGPLLSSWEHGKGLKSIIPTVLTYGIMGYPFGLMGPVGGVSVLGEFQRLPDKELYIRWLQLMTYLPVMELSVGPWMYDQEVVNHTRKLLSFRADILWPQILSSAVEEAVKLGSPIARPLWWVAPDDEVAQFIDCEFFLGNSLLVAPVLYAKARYRDVYLPKGSWYKDLLRGKRYEGGQWLPKYEVGLYEIATFTRDVDPIVES